MSWIQHNKFLTALGGGTLVAMALLFLLGSKESKRYHQAKLDFNDAAKEAQAIERGPLYPKRENLDGKTKALDEYRQALGTLQAAFEKYRPQAMQNVSPEAFTTELKSANQDVRKAFQTAKTKVPDAFFCGFENYKTSLAAGDATGILDYQLAGTKQLMLALAAAGATELKNVHRPPLAEELGQTFTPQPADVVRCLPLEITFKGREQSVREFLSSIVKPGEYYIAIRTLRITNTKKGPPRTADAKFEKSAPARPAAPADQFGDFFAQVPEPKSPDGKPTEVKPAEGKPTEGNPADGKPENEKPADGKPAEIKPAEGNVPKLEPAPADSKEILSQVLGDEQLQVFIRLDLMQFLPAKKLP